MSGAKKAVLAAVMVVAAVPLAMADGLVFDVGVNAGLGNVLSGVEFGLTPWVKVSYSLGKDGWVTLSLKNSNPITFSDPVSVSGTLRPRVDVTAGMFYATVACPVDYYPAPVTVYPYATAGLAGENWDADVTADFTVLPKFSWDDLVLYADFTFSSVTPQLSVTLPSSFDSLTLSPWVDVALGSWTIGGGVDVDVGFSPVSVTGVTPSIGISYSF